MTGTVDGAGRALVRVRIEVVANQGQFPLLGVGLLLDRDLHINYRGKTVTIN